MVWVKFIACIVIILIAGTKTTKYADVIAERTGLGRIWIGMLLLGIITSMPEMITGISSVTLVGTEGVPDLGIGTLLGSVIFNLSIIGILDLISRKIPILNYASLRHMSSASICILILIVVALTSGFRSITGSWTLGWVGIPGIVIFVIYLLGAWRIFTSERNFQLSLVPAFPEETGEAVPKDAPALPAKETKAHTDDVRWLWPKFILGAAVIVATGIWLSFVGDEIATATNWDTSFVGSMFLAISTSMPELIVAISAYRMGAVDLAVADIFGANMLDVTYIFLLDILYSKGLILSNVSGTHTISAIIAVAMSVIIILGIRFKLKRKTFIFASWYGILLIGLYLFGAWALFAGIAS